MKRVLLVDDHTSFREMLCFVFERSPGFEVVGQAGSLVEARCMLEGVDLVVVDLDLPDGDSTALIDPLFTVNLSRDYGEFSAQRIECFTA